MRYVCRSTVELVCTLHYALQSFSWLIASVLHDASLVWAPLPFWS